MLFGVWWSQGIVAQWESALLEFVKSLVWPLPIVGGREVQRMSWVGMSGTGGEWRIQCFNVVSQGQPGQVAAAVSTCLISTVSLIPWRTSSRNGITVVNVPYSSR